MRLPGIPVFPAIFAAGFTLLGVLYAMPLLQAETIPVTQPLDLTDATAPVAAPEVPLPAPHPAALRLLFDADDTNLNPQEQTQLQSFAAGMKAQNKRFQIVAYGGPAQDISSNSRRLALKRALAVHDYLITAGLSDSNMIVRALGGVRDSGPENRVDILDPK
ncbi:MAG: OmpA family protein [Parvibaculaceae bacterium]|nr:OmpA family protein [Parvibaculaceae bacterium]